VSERARNDSLAVSWWVGWHYRSAIVGGVFDYNQVRRSTGSCPTPISAAHQATHFQWPLHHQVRSLVLLRDLFRFPLLRFPRAPGRLNCYSSRLILAPFTLTMQQHRQFFRATAAAATFLHSALPVRRPSLCISSPLLLLSRQRSCLKSAVLASSFLSGCPRMWIEQFQQHFRLHLVSCFGDPSNGSRSPDSLPWGRPNRALHPCLRSKDPYPQSSAHRSAPLTTAPSAYCSDISSLPDLRSHRCRIWQS